MRKIYTTNEWNGYGKQNYYWNEYWEDGDTVYKFKCHRQKFFNGDENEWYKEQQKSDSWDIDDPALPEWLTKYLN